MNKKYQVFKWSFLLLLITFLTLYFSQMTGYYEYQNYQKMTMTKEQIERFEQDIKEGKEVDITNYVVNTTKDYKNTFSKTGTSLSRAISGGVRNSVLKLFGLLAKYVKE